MGYQEIGRRRSVDVAPMLVGDGAAVAGTGGRISPYAFLGG
jgi:hypothetical protein